ncbi:MAG: tRNA uridine-5-carboxymethylaminomethyl(34) synthesis GTPase MnmE [Oscillospiraceae bacterium]|jgi:tRNA modification GTPase|nr:tRNA uridine-5-carboxymethylaminomethyl(34) synthesis GTPase MnmE [Oscillospiraceae bacterium]
MEKETIAAVATAQGHAGISVIRMSGKQAIAIADKIFKSESGKKLADMPGYTAKYGKVYSFSNKLDGHKFFVNQELLDEAVALVFRAPHSYTGENAVEISCHGGIYVTKQVLHALFQAGARPAEAGEFTKRAVLNGKIDLTKAEAIMDIISAKNKQALKSAISAREGNLHREIDRIKSSLCELAAKLSIWADYPDEDIVTFDLEELSKILSTCEQRLKNLILTYDKGRIIKEGIYTAIIGSPNVGKSTLMNLLAGWDRSIVTEIAGTTRDIIEETVLLGDLMLRLVDTAGIHEAGDIVEKIGVNKAREQLKKADLILTVFDNSRSLNKDDIEILNFVKNSAAIAVVNKTDLPPMLDKNLIQESIFSVVEISSTLGLGLDGLKNEIINMANIANFDPFEAALANERQFYTTKKTFEYIQEAENALLSGLTLDAVFVSVQCAIESLCNLTGESASEALFNEIFSRFCVGK